jgi:hemolysin III
MTTLDEARSSAPETVRQSVRDLAAGVRDVAADVRPAMRGWLHALTFPAAVAAGGALVAHAPTDRARLACVAYAASAALLFGVSGLFHRIQWVGRTYGVLRRLDHANIYLFIAGSYTPFALLALSGPTSTAVLVGVWAGCLGGALFRVLWVNAPRWLYTPLYAVPGGAAVLVVPQLMAGAGLVAFALTAAGILLYCVGGVVYGLQRPNPAPRWFGFHEVFHALTVLAFGAQYVAVTLIVHAAG